MRQLSPISTYYISRVAFQSILHQALIQQDAEHFFGLLGSKDKHGCTLDKAVVLSAVSQSSDTVLEQWNNEGIALVGVFLMQGALLPDDILDKLPNTYVRLCVKLDEKGRLDLLADLCDQTKHEQRVLPLSLIEDGQQVSYA